MRLLMEICEELRMRVLGEKLRVENESSKEKNEIENMSLIKTEKCVFVQLIVIVFIIEASEL